MRFCLSVSSYHRLFVNQEMDARRFIRKAAEHRFSAVELCDLSISGTDETTRRNLKAWLSQYQCELVCIAVRNDFSLADRERWQTQIRHVERWLQAASELEVPFVRVWAGRASASDAAVERVIAGFQLVEHAARRLGVTMVLENHGGVTLNPSNVLRIVDAIGSPWFAICPDFGHFLPDDRIEGLRQMAPHIRHVHAKTHAFRSDGEEVSIPYGDLLGVLRASGYRGYLSVEYEGDTEHDDGIRSTIDLISRYI